MLDTKIEAAKAAKIIQEGGIVCFPSETVYALCCSFSDDKAIERLYKIKERNVSKPFSLFVNDINSVLQENCIGLNHILYAKALLESSATIIIKPKNTILSNRSKLFFSETVGIRKPKNIFAIETLKILGKPCIATSVNLSGDSAVSKFCDIPKKIINAIDFAFNKDDDVIFSEHSAVVDLSGNEIIVVRQGIPANLDEILNLGKL